MNTEAVDVSKRGWNASLAEQVHQSMDPLGVIYVKVPKHAVVRNVCLGMTLMRAVHGWKLDGISNEEYWQVVEDKVLDPFLRVKFGRPAANITNRIT